MDSLRKRVSEDGDLAYNNFSENKFLNDEEEEFSRMQKERLISLTARSARETFYQTPLGKEVERLEERVSKYFIVGIFKEGNKVNFYLPGKANSKGITKIRQIEDNKKEWGIRINKIIDSHINLTPGVKGFYGGVELDLSYDRERESYEMNLSFRF